MANFLLLPQDGGLPATATATATAGHADLLRKVQAASSEHLTPPPPYSPPQPPPPPPPPPSVARRVSSLASRLAEALRARASRAQAERRLLQQRSERQQELEQRMAKATTYGEWEAAAQLLDELENYEAWKARDDGDDGDDIYSPEGLRARLQELEDARRSADVRRMMHLVRTALSRDIDGISHAGLYNHTHTGTKHLVERYCQASVDLLRALVERSRSAAALPRGLTHRDMLEQLLLARRSYGRSALILSGGAVYGMAHIGVLKALFEQRLLPRIISGTSAGSIVAAVVCTRTEEQIPLLLECFAHGDLAVFTDKDNPDSWLTHIGRALRYGAWHDSRHLARVMRGLLGDITFQEAFNRTQRILNITVSSKPGLQLPPLLNYLTAPDVIIWSAVVASCSIPGVFDPRPLLVRDAATGEHVPWDPAEQLWIDGSLDNDVPVERLGEMLNVNHFIVSQTNPHIVLFVSGDEKKTSGLRGTGQGEAGSSGSSDSSGGPLAALPSLSSVLYTLSWLSKSEAIYYLETLVDLGVFRETLGMLLHVLKQRYTGDINILPRMSLAWSTNLIRNPTTEFMLEACRVGEQATWPSISRIEQACAIELALDQAVYSLRERITFSESQVNLRRLYTGSHELGVRTSGLISGAPRVSAFSDGPPAPAPAPAPASRSRSPVAHRHSQHHKLNQRKRRGSGGSIQLSARRRSNRNALDTILSEDGGGQDSDAHPSPGLSLAERRGMADMNLSTLFASRRPKLMRSNSSGASPPPGIVPAPASGAAAATPPLAPDPAPTSASTPAPALALAPTASSPHALRAVGDLHQRISPYRGPIKQNSLQQLPMATPSAAPTPLQQTPSFTRKGFSWDGNGDGGGSTSPLAAAGSSNEQQAAYDEAELPVLQTRSWQRRQRRNSSASSAVSAVSAVSSAVSVAAAAAVTAAHQAMLQAVGGSDDGSCGGGGRVSTVSESQSPRAQRVLPVPTPASAPVQSSSSSLSALPVFSRVSSTEWYPGVLRRRPLAAEEDGSEETDDDDDDGDAETDDSDDTSGDSGDSGLSDPGGRQDGEHDERDGPPEPRPISLVQRSKSEPAMAAGKDAETKEKEEEEEDDDDDDGWRQRRRRRRPAENAAGGVD